MRDRWVDRQIDRYKFIIRDWFLRLWKPAITTV